MERVKLNTGEALVPALRALYERSGYSRYKMSKFEEYDLYVRNKDFLVSDSVITFTDTNGRLMALKPDVTLSIVKNSKDTPGFAQKVYYQENVYRISKGTASFKEIEQVGLECMGDLDAYCIFEVLSLACESLRMISPDAVLDLSHLGIVSALLDDLSQPPEVNEQLLKCLGEKNPHELRRICAENGVVPEKTARLVALAETYGPPAQVLQALDALDPPMPDRAPLDALRTLVGWFDGTPYAGMLRLDFSVVSAMKYYNGVVFKGFVPGVPESILSGGQYDHLMKKLHRASGAIGFAMYLDLLERFDRCDPYDVDTVLLYDETADLNGLMAAVAGLQADGCAVSAQRTLPEKFRARRVLQYKDGEVIPVE
ncbi:MAG: ATP phosphoribosyltransferase regulatory subunit [Clostridia bacterium]|nr:ATP phosphoribosyltransferase regulatory subunit [Clostridia bacterium]